MNQDMQMYSFYDSAVGVYTPPMFVQNDQVALRTFRELIRDPNHQFNRFSEHFSMFHVGIFHSATAGFTLSDAVRLVAKAHELKASLAESGQLSLSLDQGREMLAQVQGVADQVSSFGGGVKAVDNKIDMLHQVLLSFINSRRRKSWFKRDVF